MGNRVDNNTGGLWASWYMQGSNNALGEYHEGRVRNTMGGRNELDALEVENHAAARRKMNPLYAPSESEVKQRQEAQESAEIQRAVNAVQSKMKVDARDAHSPNLHSLNDVFEQSKPADEHMSIAKMAAFMSGSTGLA